MTSSKSNFIIQCIVPMALLAAAAAPLPALAQGVQKRETQEAYENSANKHVKNAVSVVKRMESDPTMQRVMIDAKGIYIVPAYGRAALGIGGQGGAGVLLIRQGPDWSDPAFYNIGGISIGAQVGAEGGAVAFVLKNDKAVQRFTDKNNFSLSADAGITVVNWTKIAQGSTGEGDVIAWSGTKGLFGNVATIGVNDIRYNERMTNAYYGKATSAMEVIDGKVKNPTSDALKQALADTSAGAASGKSGGGTGSMPEQKK
jgi:lipid-binding SYLF domain-containing protein